ncbi:MAG: PD-(D/E)XK nuclease family protein [Bacilli bacterium]
MFNDLKKDTIIITNNSYKKNILKELSKDDKLYPTTFMSLKEFIDNYYFTYDEKAIYYLMTTYHYKYDVAKVYLDNLIYIEDINYPSDKLNYLVKLKQELKENNLLIYNELFKCFIKDKDIIVYNLYLDKFVLDVLKKLNAKVINKELKNNSITVYPFNNIKEEVKFIFTEISKLLEKGISYNNIKLINLTEEYHNEFKRVSSFYKIPIKFQMNTYFETEIVQKFIELIQIYNLNDALNKLKEIYDFSNLENNNIYNKIINICNKIIFVKEKEIFTNMFIELIKKEQIKENIGIDIINLEDYIDDSYYVFVMGFNQNSIPKIFKDESYITDNLLEYINKDSVIEKNIKEKEKTKIILSNIKNLTITYKLNSNKEVCYPSNLINDDLFKIENYNINNNISYSKEETIIELGKKLDNLKKYGEKDKDLDLYYNTLDINYDTYDNKYKTISKDKLLKYLNNNLLLSYTSMNDYYKCSFKYYINHILKVDKFEDSFNIFIGNLFHYILSICFNDNFDFEKEYNEYLNKRILSPKEKFFCKKLKKELLFIIENIKDQYLLSDLKNALYEENIYIKINDNVTFNGKIDKIMYKEIDGINYIAVIDYKTGSTDISLKYADYGIGLQLPVYLYLIKNSNKFKNILFTGFYLQKILNKEINITPGKTYLDLKKESLKLIGYSNQDTSILSKLDRSYEDSEMIKSMKITSKGFYHYAKIMSNDEINNLIEKTLNKISLASEKILEADFNINPKIIDGDNIGCKYCKYQDICFIKEEDKVYINTKEDKD